MLFIATTILMFVVGCDKKEEVVSHGSFSLEGTTYSITALRVDHVGYAETDSSAFVLRTSFTGPRIEIIFYMVAPDNDFVPGKKYSSFCPDSLSRIIVTSREGDTLHNVMIASATLMVDSVVDPIASGKNFLQYMFTIETNDYGTTNGDFLGKHIVNYVVDQPSYGSFSFDTIECGVAKPTLYCWEHLFSDDTNYFELKFFSSNARFNDNGKIQMGVQMVIGLHSFQTLYPAEANYPVSLEAQEQTAYYGHKVGNALWGTYWQTFYSGSIVGKANVLSDTIKVLQWNSEKICLEFAMKDQLGNNVVGYYEGGYYRN